MLDVATWIKRLRNVADRLEAQTAFLDRAHVGTHEREGEYPKMTIELEIMVDDATKL
jgi:hypothetical protein